MEMIEEQEPTKDICRRQNCYCFYYYYYNYEVNNFLLRLSNLWSVILIKRKPKIFLFSVGVIKKNFVISTKIMTTRKNEEEKNNVSTCDHVVNIFYDFINSLLYSILQAIRSYLLWICMPILDIKLQAFGKGSAIFFTTSYTTTIYIDYCVKKKSSFVLKVLTSWLGT